MKYIDAEKLKAEIERLHKEHTTREYHDEAALVLEDLEDYIDSLQQEQPEMDLEEEVKQYYSDNFAYISSDQPTLSILTNIARHFAEWGAEHLKR